MSLGPIASPWTLTIFELSPLPSFHFRLLLLHLKMKTFNRKEYNQSYSLYLIVSLIQKYAFPKHYMWIFVHFIHLFLQSYLLLALSDTSLHNSFASFKVSSRQDPQTTKTHPLMSLRCQNLLILCIFDQHNSARHNLRIWILNNLLIFQLTYLIMKKRNITKYLNVAYLLILIVISLRLSQLQLCRFNIPFEIHKRSKLTTEADIGSGQFAVNYHCPILV